MSSSTFFLQLFTSRTTELERRQVVEGHGQQLYHPHVVLHEHTDVLLFRHNTTRVRLGRDRLLWTVYNPGSPGGGGWGGGIHVARGTIYLPPNSQYTAEEQSTGIPFHFICSSEQTFVWTCDCVRMDLCRARETQQRAKGSRRISPVGKCLFEFVELCSCFPSELCVQYLTTSPLMWS